VRLPFPERVPLFYSVCFATLLCIAQLLEGTSAPFALGCFLFIIVATLAFNLAGGFTRPSGGYIFFYALLAVIVGLCWKAFLGEPADSNLNRPLLTILAELGGMTAMFGAVFLSQKFTARRPFLGNLVTGENLQSAAVGCMIVGLLLTVVFTVVPYENGTFLSSLAQLDRFLPLALILGVIYQIRKSRGTSSVNWLVLICGSTIFAAGLLGFSKQGMFTPLLCWLIAAASQRYKISGYQVLGFVLAAAFMSYYLIPYSQFGRNFRTFAFIENGTGAQLDKTEAFMQNVKNAVYLLSDLGYVRQEYEKSSGNPRNEAAPAYFDKPQGLFDRLQMISMDDAIINVTEQNGKFGMSPVILEIEGMVPHFIWHDKPTFAFGNVYAHEIGMVSEEDVTTGISFSPVGEAFHIERWAGIFIVAPLLWIMLFALFDSLCGDVRKHPWGLLVIVLFAHVAPEAMLGGVIYMLWYGAIGIVFAALAAAYVMPILGSIFTGRGGTSIGRIRPIRSIPRRLPSIQPSQSSGQ